MTSKSICLLLSIVHLVCRGQYNESTLVSPEHLGPTRVDFVDMNGDSILDLFVQSYGSHDSIAWYQNDGFGGFGDPLYVIKGGSYLDWFNEMRTGDLDGDGDLDILGSVMNSNKIVWHENNGMGVFGPENIVDSGLDNESGLRPIDINNDGIVDIVAYEIDNQGIFTWYEGLGGGLFAGQQLLWALPYPFGYDVEFIDVEHDGDYDMVVDAGGSGLYIRYNDGLGGFPIGTSFNGGLQNVIDIDTVDMNSDGFPDLLVASSSESSVAWLENDTAGLFLPPSIISDSAVGVRDAAAGDIDGDGDYDVMIASDVLDSVYWIRNYGSGFDSLIGVYGGIEVSLNLLLCDIDSDGDSDVIIPDGADHYVAIAINDSAGTFSSSSYLSKYTDDPVVVTYTDVDADGIADVIVGSDEDGKISWYKRSLSGSLGRQLIISDSIPGLHSLDVHDLDGNGAVDIAYGTLTSDGGQVGILLNDGVGGFTLSQIVDETNWWRPTFELIDVNSDGFLDMFISGFQNDSLKVFLNNGVGQYSLLQSYQHSSVNIVTDIASGDIDSDGNQDIALISNGTDQVMWLAGNGVGAFGSPTSVAPTTDNGMILKILDVDLDGDVDIVCSTAGWQNNYLLKYNNDGTGMFSGAYVLDSLLEIDCLIKSDVNADGYVDLIAGSSSYLYAFINDTGNQWYSVQLQDDNVPGLVNALAIGQIDQDSISDLIIGRTTGIVHWRSLSDPSLSIKELESPQFINAYPNPVSTFCIVDLPGDFSSSHVRVIDVRGETVRTHTTVSSGNGVRVDLSGLASGLYILQITTTDGQYQSQVIVH